MIFMISNSNLLGRVKLPSFKKYFLRAYYMPDTVLGLRDVTINNTVKIPYIQANLHFSDQRSF